jgi:hypothetical protein
MTVSDLQQWMIDNPIASLFIVIILSIITFLIARGILARGLIVSPRIPKRSTMTSLLRICDPFEWHG